MTRERLSELDGLKAIGAFFVLMYHSQALTHGIEADFTNLVLVWARALLSTCCPLFFFVSGTLALRGKPDVEKCVRSATKLLFLTLFWAVVSWPVLQLQHGESITIGEWVSGVMTLELWRTNVFWFLPVLAMLQLVRPIVRAVYEADARLFHYLLAGTLVISFGYDALSRCLQIAQWLSGSGAPMKLAGFIGLFRPIEGYIAWALAYYLLGMWVSERKKEDQAHRKVHEFVAVFLGPLFLAAYGLIAMHLTGSGVDVTFGGYGFAGTAVAVLALYDLFLSLRGRARWEKFVQLIGENALAVYVLPWFVTYPLAQLVLSINSPIERLIVAVPSCLALIVGAALMGRILTKTRVGKILLSV